MRKARKIQLTIKANGGNDTYLPSWSVREGLRELVQNARDAEKQFNAPFSIEWYHGATGRDTLRITNEGCNLDRESLLFGHTTKYGNSEMIGSFGEGLKLAMLVLVREGLKLKIYTGNDQDRTGEIWIPFIERSDTFNADVLAVAVKDAAYRKRVRIEVEGICKEDWENIFKHDYLFLPGTDKGKHIKLSAGELLLEERFRGKVFVKGIFICNRDTRYGYNFLKVELDRDRKMVDWYSYEVNKGRMFDEAARTNAINASVLLDLLESDCEDVRGYSFPYEISQQVVDKLKNEFLEKHGSRAFPVAARADAVEFSHLDPDVTPVVVPENMLKILQKVFGTFDDVKKRLKNEVLKTYSIESLSGSEKKSLVWGCTLVDIALEKMLLSKIVPDAVVVCDFRTGNILGQYDGGIIRISKGILEDRNMVLRVLVHEVAHQFGVDGDKSHVNVVEDIWMNIFGTITSKFD